MDKVTIDLVKCDLCGKCIDDCPGDAMRMEIIPRRVAVNVEICMNNPSCTVICVSTCEKDAITVVGD